MEQSVKQILSTIESAIQGFQGVVPGIQKKVFEELQPIIKQLEIKDGKLLNNVNNLKHILGLKNKLQRVIINAEYKKSVEKFVESYNVVSDLNINYFRQFSKNYKPSKVLPIIKQMAVEQTINDLVGQGMINAVINPVQSILNQNITSGGNYVSFQDQLRNHIINNNTGEGSVERYTKQITTDAINQYNAQYHDTIAQDLQFNWLRYIGSNITTSREFCLLLTKKEWVHKSELSGIIKGKIDNDEIKISKSTGLPLGMMLGTTSDNFKVRRGGYNCGHQAFWVPDNVVPKNLINKFQQTNTDIEIVENKNAINLKEQKDFTGIKSVQDLFLKNGDLIKQYFNNTTFKSLSTTTRRGVNGFTDMNGNIALSKNKTDDFVRGLNNLKDNKDLTHDQEKAFATMWHEIWHNSNKATTTRLTKSETRYMEIGNEFVSRKTLDDFFGLFGGKLKDQSLKNYRGDTGYNQWVVNYDKLIKHFKADETKVLNYMKDKMTNGDYEKVKSYLKEAIKESTDKSIKSSDINTGLQDAVLMSDAAFSTKYQ